MKKILFTLIALMSVFSAKAFVFDGIDLNGDILKVTREVAAKGYFFDLEKQCLKGNCQGTEIFLKFNTEDSKDAKKIGQLIVEVPMKNASSEADVKMLLNVMYHQVESSVAGATRYSVDADGTTLDVTMNGNNLVLTYNTPYYKASK